MNNHCFFLNILHQITGFQQELELVKTRTIHNKSEVDTVQQNSFKTLQAQYTLMFNENGTVKQQLEETKHLLAQARQQHMLQLEQIEVCNRQAQFVYLRTVFITFLWVKCGILKFRCLGRGRRSTEENATRSNTERRGTKPNEKGLWSFTFQVWKVEA